MNRLVASPARLALALVVAAAAAPAAARPFAPPPEVVALREEIAALRLDHALALTKEQARALLPVLQRGAAAADALRARVASPDPALVAALTKAREELRAGGDVSPATLQALRDARKQVAAGSLGEMRSLRKEVHAILTPAQLQAVRALRPGLGLGAADGAPGRGPGMGPEAGPGPDAGFGPGPGPGRRFAGRLVLARILLSDAFRALVQARAQ